MPEYTLTVLDVTGIQDYIFGSNRVPENVGASHLVHQATSTWVRKSLPAERHNIQPTGTIDTSRRLEDDGRLDAEVVLSGGGNVLILFRTPEIARAVVGKLTRTLLEEAPGLELVAAHHSFGWETPVGGECGAHRQLYKQLNLAKQQRRRSAPLMGLGVTLECRATGMPAVTVEDERPVSAEVAVKLRQRDAVDARFDAIFKDVAQGYEFRKDFGALGGAEGDMSYIAVVHADGNNMGKRFEQIIEQYAEPAQNRACLDALRTLSLAVENAGRQALKSTVRRLMECLNKDQSEAMRTFVPGIVDYRTKEPVIPFRPIVYGGDDVTFVCDGRLGLGLAAIYLEEWERATEEDKTIGKAYACAGVAVVKTHYPFVRAYELAARLCEETKKAVRKRTDPADASALDWHFAMSGIGGTLEQIREREYRAVKGDPLYLRPLALHAPGLTPEWFSWATFDRVTRTFQTDDYWRQRRNKVKELREVLRRGPLAVEQFLQAFTIKSLPTIDSTKADLQQRGWFGSYCGYFDAIEALDFYLPLAKEE
jgi:hypothetical protein